MRKAAIAARATRTAADKAETAADCAERAVAIREVRSLDGTIAERTARLHGAEARIEDLEQQLAATGRFGRAALRGDERAAVEADREALLRTREETARELEQMGTRLQDVTRQAGPVNEHEAVLTEADMPQQEKAALLRRAEALGRGALQLERPF
ncbi:hypothetical protein [Streptomyces sp. NPDC087300]|uniref:hypothetical protein n=1 Tax=Streptomyces sp. NPDC087300 TaxID=3365780 RepID=UPI0038293FE7